MGVCCGQNDNPAQQRRRQMRGMDATGIEHDMVDNVRRQTKQQRKQNLETFMSMKTAKKFKKVERFSDHYSLLKEIGAGAFGSVKLGRHKATQQPCAVKIIRKSSLSHEIYQQLNKNEFEVLEETPHPNITRIYELMEDKRNYFIVMEVVTGGNLLQKFEGIGSFTESQAASVIQQLLNALKFMHNKNIMHRDLKPENILCEENANSTDERIEIKLTDFGFAKKYDPDEPENLSLGTPFYMAPELCQEKPYNSKVDVWAVGVILYLLIAGTPCFINPHSRQQPTKDSIHRAIIHDEPNWSYLEQASDELKDFVKQCLEKNPITRPTIAELHMHPWITENAWENNTVDQGAERRVTANLANFVRMSQF